MTRGQLRTLTLSWLDDVNGGYFTESQVNTWLNNAQREAQKQLIEAGENYYVKRVSTETITEKDTYAPPDGFIRGHKLEIVTSGTGVNEVRQVLTFIPLMQLDQLSMSTGTPLGYTIRKNCFVLRPIPDRAYTWYLHYSKLVTDMSSDSDTPDVPEQFHEYLAILATMDGFLKDRRQMSDFVKAKLEKYEKLFQQIANNRNVDFPREVVTTEDHGFGYLF